MDNKPFSIINSQRWTIIAQDSNKWRIGIYNPEFSNPEDIPVFEKHSCPEFFICVNGRCGLVLFSNEKEQHFILQPNEAIIVTDYHNGFKVDPEGFFIVVEQTTFTTEFIERKKL